jgi:hypothetical protein
LNESGKDKLTKEELDQIMMDIPESVLDNFREKIG